MIVAVGRRRDGGRDGQGKSWISIDVAGAGINARESTGSDPCFLTGDDNGLTPSCTGTLAPLRGAVRVFDLPVGKNSTRPIQLSIGELGRAWRGASLYAFTVSKSDRLPLKCC